MIEIPQRFNILGVVHAPFLVTIMLSTTTFKKAKLNFLPISGKRFKKRRVRSAYLHTTVKGCLHYSGQMHTFRGGDGSEKGALLTHGCVSCHVCCGAAGMFYFICGGVL